MKRISNSVKTWYWKDDDESFKPYSRECQEMLNQWNYQRETSIDFRINGIVHEIIYYGDDQFRDYLFDLPNSYQNPRYRKVIAVKENYANLKYISSRSVQQELDRIKKSKKIIIIDDDKTSSHRTESKQDYYNPSQIFNPNFDRVLSKDYKHEKTEESLFSPFKDLPSDLIIKIVGLCDNLNLLLTSKTLKSYRCENFWKMYLRGVVCEVTWNFYSQVKYSQYNNETATNFFNCYFPGIYSGLVRKIEHFRQFPSFDGTYRDPELSGFPWIVIRCKNPLAKRLSLYSDCYLELVFKDTSSGFFQFDGPYSFYNLLYDNLLKQITKK